MIIHLCLLIGTVEVQLLPPHWFKFIAGFDPKVRLQCTLDKASLVAKLTKSNNILFHFLTYFY